MATVDAAAQHIFLDPRNFHRLVEKGAIEKQPPGGYDLDIVREEYIRHIRSVAQGREKKPPGEIDPEYEKARKDKELADRTSLQNQVTRGELVSIDEVGRQVEAEYSVVRERLLGIPGKFGADLSPAQVARIEAEILDALDELHDPDDILSRVSQPADDEADEGPQEP